MARLNYFDIVAGIKTVLESDVDLQDHDAKGVRIYLSQRLDDGLPYAEMCPCVLVNLKSRAVPPERQRLTAGKTTDFNIQIELVCVEYDLESMEAADQRRDELMSLVEIALMKDRTLAGTVTSHTLAGGRFDNIRDRFYLSAAEINIFVTARTTYQ
jgi:hypothetical protein